MTPVDRGGDFCYTEWQNIGSTRARMQVQDGRRSYELRGRVEALVRWVVQNEERITRPTKVQVTFDCAGKTVSAEVRERERVTPA